MILFSGAGFRPFLFVVICTKRPASPVGRPLLLRMEMSFGEEIFGRKRRIHIWDAIPSTEKGPATPAANQSSGILSARAPKSVQSPRDWTLDPTASGTS